MELNIGKATDTCSYKKHPKMPPRPVLLVLKAAFPTA